MTGLVSKVRLLGPSAFLLATVLTLAVFAMVLFAMQRLERNDQAQRELEGDLRDRIDAWEARLLERLVLASETAAADPAQGRAVQARLRQELPWFDSLYVWEPATLTNSGMAAGSFDWPAAPATEDRLGLGRVPCIVKGRIVRSQPVFDPLQAAELMRAFCRDQPPAVRITALTDSVDLLLRHGLYAEAQVAIEADDVLPDGVDLQQAMKAGIPVQKAVVLRLEQADILENLGEEDLANDLRTVTGFEICALDAPDAQGLLLQYLAFPIIERLRRGGHTEAVSRLGSAYEMADRRVRAYRHIAENLLLRPAQPNAPPRWLYDQHADNPYLLFTRWSDSGQVGVGLQVEQEMLLEDFLEEMRSLRKQLTITNADRTVVVAGVRRSGETAVSLPFSSTLTHLRVGLRQEAVDERAGRSEMLWTVLGGLIASALAIGIVAFVQDLRARIEREKASAELEALLARQRDFATRVTHELKTPLAGIRVMGENLELGHFHGDDQRRSMAAAIVAEADKLTERVNEILEVAREREVRPPEPFDPGEVVMATVEQWEPRMELNGVMFESDIGTTDPVLGDGDAVRDAVSCLLDNALKYRREDADEPLVQLTVGQDGDRVRIEVVDNGLGVPVAMRAQIFERFVRVEGPNRGMAGGHGLGLAQVAEIARAHGGRATCSEGLDGGARFTIDLPAHTV